MNNFSYGKGAQSQEIDYGDIPDNMDEEQMRAYLNMESKLVMPNQKKRDSFEQQWNNGRQQLNQQQPQQPQQNKHKKSSFSPSPPQPASAQYPSSTQTYGYSQNTNKRSQHKGIEAVGSFSRTTDYDPSQIDRMSTVTIVSQKGNHRREHSFAKQPVQNPYQHNYNNPNVNMNGANHANMNMNNGQQYNNNHNNHGHGQHMEPNPRSALTAQISPNKHLGQDSGQLSGVIQSRNPEGKLVVKQMPYSKKTHVCVNVFVEISSEHTEHVIVYFNKHLSVAQFLDLLKNETNNAAFKDTELEIWCADDDGDIEDDFPPPEQTAIIANLGLDNFFIKLKGANDAQRDDIRRSTLSYKDQLLSTKEVDKMHSLDEDEEDEYEEDEYEEDEGCKCIIL